MLKALKSSRLIIGLVGSIALLSTIGIDPNISNAIGSNIAQNNNSQSNDATTAVEEGNKLVNVGRYQEALEKYQQALIICRKQKDRKNESLTLYNIGWVYKNLGQHAKALDYYQQSLTISKKIGDKASESDTLCNIGGVYKSLGKYAKALDRYRQCLTIKKEIGDKDGEGHALNNIGGIYYGLSQHAKALEYFQQSLTIKKEIGDKNGESHALNNIGGIYYSLGRYAKALEYHQQSLKICKEIGDKAGEGRVLTSIGSVYYSSGRYAKALEYHQQSLKIRKEIGDKAGEGGSLNNIGTVYYRLGRYAKALEYYQQSLMIGKEINDKADEGGSLNNIGTAYYSLGQYTKALEYYQQSLKIYKEIGNKDGEGATFSNTGAVYQDLGQYAKALEYYQQSLKIYKEIGNKDGEDTALNNIGEVYNSLGQYAKALNYFQQSLTISKEIGDKAGEGITLHNLGFTFYRQKRLPESEKVLRQAITIWESFKAGLKDQDKISLSNKASDTYKLLQKVLIEQGKAQAALEISERAKARALAELLASKVNTISSTAQSKLRQAPNLSKIQQIATQKNSTLIQYSLVDEAIYIWVIQPTGKISFKQSKLPPNTKIKDLVIATRDSVGANRGRNRSKNDSKPPVKSDLKQLHQLLIAPIASELPKDPTASVTIIPQDDLLIVPFAALEDSQGKYLIEQHTINIAPSIQVLGLTTSTRTQSGKPLVVGNPIMPLLNGEPLSNLQGAEEEARSIGTIINTQPLIGAAADKKEVIKRMQNANLIHLATHGFFIRVEGELPGAVALTGGYLTSDEVFDMQLAADLVVLSACDTGRGDITGDGVVGLSRSLVVAGVPSVMVSLWEVDDKATKVLMEEFYHQLWVKKISKAQAIRQAMLRTKEQFEDPNLWGAFMLVGEGR